MPFASRTPGAADILYVMALDNEYGPHLRSRITPLMTGVGPVEAAIVVTHALAKLDAAGKLPALVVSLGSAGSAKLEQTGVYQATSVDYRDMDASPLGFEPGVTPLLDQPAIIALGPFVPEIAKATLSTGANVVSGAAYRGISADMVDMETYAVLRACQRFKVPLIALRGISDGDEELGHLDDWTRYLHLVDEKLAHAVDLLEAAIASGTLE
ncbi:5'-methylthioadenosine/S-adenosylhomocysteine nucleosidase [Devosia insulae DS-56]|uniref:5'-methylthioadenosine/S-adenosylhomocysteine nucleosidase n=1 Tax=Devosia insulae DS-56 TaxID=1116389 RepID=A0A1E5XIZ4_9HYPH|nr:5'-methylthioadenosine/S-adenosylhomocysteine nucleosidase [Devosia insulae]OEO28551.1 5'-methylthioadenosine/S-adenosylhomocysteine nucleosidase [Devosia insulae DS-56]